MLNRYFTEFAVTTLNELPMNMLSGYRYERFFTYPDCHSFTAYLRKIMRRMNQNLKKRYVLTSIHFATNFNK